jgi:hypothetical protein
MNKKIGKGHNIGKSNTTGEAQSMSEAIEQAFGNEEKAPLTPKQIEKRKKAEEQYWNTMVSRKEAYQMAQNMVQQGTSPIYDHVRMLFVQVTTMTNILVDKGVCTREELDEVSKPILEKLYPKQPTPEQPIDEEVKPDANGETTGHN